VQAQRGAQPMVVGIRSDTAHWSAGVIEYPFYQRVRDSIASVPLASALPPATQAAPRAAAPG
jgi:hypothetical protein